MQLRETQLRILQFLVIAVEADERAQPFDTQIASALGLNIQVVEDDLKDLREIGIVRLIEYASSPGTRQPAKAVFTSAGRDFAERLVAGK
jgi:predicted transcriptional regulator